MRDQVEILTGLGLRQDEIVRVIKNPQTGKPLDPKTLRVHFREELSNGIAKVKAAGAMNLLNMTKTNPACAIFFAKVKLGWKDHISIQHSGKIDSKPTMTIEQMDRRINQILEGAAKRNTRASKPASKKPKAAERPHGL
jgi:hypothetical protein